MSWIVQYVRSVGLNLLGKHQIHTSKHARKPWNLVRYLRVAPWEFLAMLIAVLSVAYVGSQVVAYDDVRQVESLPSDPETSIHFSTCTGPVRVNCVVDGDTIWVNGTKIRIADIDTPEVFVPRCSAELVRGQEATFRLLELLNLGAIEVARYRRDEDTYGRKLRIIKRDGRSLGAVLINEGLARRWNGARHSWCD